MYYLIEITTGDSKIAGKAVYGYSTKNEAVANFHGKLAAAMKSELYDSALVMVVDGTGRVINRELYEKPEPVEEE